MNSFSLTIVVLCNFVAIGLLPVMFFRSDGTYNLRWLATGAPFFIAPTAVLAGYLDWLPPLYAAQGTALEAGQFAAVVLSVLSVALIAMTVGGHRVPLALWHQDNDAPVQIVTWGAYARIRHPFYTSFILAFTSAALAFPHGLTFGCLLYSVAALTVTAKREEHRLSESEFGQEYVEYMKVAGRFFPRLGK